METWVLRPPWAWIFWVLWAGLPIAASVLLGLSETVLTLLSIMLLVLTPVIFRLGLGVAWRPFGKFP